MKNNQTLLQAALLLRGLSDNSFLVGGCVRDSLLGVAPKDFDFATDASFDSVVDTFQANGWKVTLAGANFLVCVVSKNGQQFEVANFRTDSSFGDGRRHDSVAVGTMKDDAFRRDFTVNALYMDPFTGDVVDPTGQGLADVASKTLRFVGCPKARLAEDGLRVFRFFRFVSKGFTPFKPHLKVVRGAFNKSVAAVSAERLRDELEKMAGTAGL